MESPLKTSPGEQIPSNPFACKCKFEGCNNKTKVIIVGKLHSHLCLKHFLEFRKQDFYDYVYRLEEDPVWFDFEEEAPWIKRIQQ